MPLKDWQKPLQEKLKDMLNRYGVVLNALPTGAGKTYIVAETACQMPDYSLFVTSPKATLTPWRRVLEEYGLTSRTLAVLNWEKLMTKKTKWYTDTGWKLPEKTLFVADEVHKGASGPNSITSKMLAALKIRRIPIILQSATVADSPLKLRASGYLLGLHEFNTRSYFNWCRRWGCYNSPFHSGLEFPKNKRGTELMRKLYEEHLKDRMLRCTFDDIPGFPDCDTEAVLFDLDKKYTDEINKIYEELEAELKKPQVNPMTEQLRARQRVELFKVPLLIDLVHENVEAGKSVVVFVNFRETLAEIRAGLKLANVSEVHGGQAGDAGAIRRQADIDAFQSNKNHVLLATLDAGGPGLSLHDELHERPRISLICPAYSATNFRQALGRIHRVGGTKAVQHIVLAAGTIEERVKNRLDKKLDNIDAFNGITDEDLQ